jgi:acyl-CoA hydrolase
MNHPIVNHQSSMDAPPIPAAKRWQDSATETVQVVLPNDSNPLGFMLGGSVMHLIDITGAIACHRHTNTLALTAAVDGLEFLHPIRIGDIVILKSRVTATFRTSLEVEVEVFSEQIPSGVRRRTSRAYLTFVAIDREGRPQPVPPLRLETPEDETRSREAHARRAARLASRAPR